MNNQNDISKIIKDFGILSIETKREVNYLHSYSSEPDPKWKFTDAQGHYHYISKKEYPTLIWIVDEEADDEYTESGHYECAACNERIEPGRIPPSMLGVAILGMWHCEISFIDGATYALSGDEISTMEELINMKYDYGHSRLKEYIEKIKAREIGYLIRFNTTS